MKKATGSFVNMTRKNLLLLGLVIGVAVFGFISFKAAAGSKAGDENKEQMQQQSQSGGKVETDETGTDNENRAMPDNEKDADTSETVRDEKSKANEKRDAERLKTVRDAILASRKAPQDDKPIVTQPELQGVSDSLLSIAEQKLPQVPKENGKSRKDAVAMEAMRQLKREAGPSVALGPVVESFLQTEALSPSAAVLGASFEGPGQGIPGYVVTAAPTDSTMAVGPNHIIAWVNVHLMVFNKSGTPLLPAPGFIQGSDIWAGLPAGSLCRDFNRGDPLVQYDRLANRWVLSQFAFNGTFSQNAQCFAVSTTGDPLGTYSLYQYNFGTELPDYGKIGIWNDAYYVSYNMFNNGTTFSGGRACAYDRTVMVAGGAATQICFNSTTRFSMLPADLDGATLPTDTTRGGLFLDWNWAFLASGPYTMRISRLKPDFVTPANSTFNDGFGGAPFTSIPFVLPAADIASCGDTGGACVPQLGTGNLLDTLGSRHMYRLAYRNRSGVDSLVFTQSLDPTGASVAALRWYEIRNPLGNPAVPATAPFLYQNSTFAPTTANRWMGSAAMNGNGDILIGYSISSSTTNPSIAVAGRQQADPLNTLQAEQIAVTGTGSQTGTLERWGDYTTMQVDPADDTTFWYINQYLAANGTFNWRTRIVSYAFGVSQPDLTITKTHTGNFTQGSTGNNYTVVVTNSGAGDKNAGQSVSVTDAPPTGLTVTAMSGTGWTCTTLPTCTRNDLLTPTSSYPALTVTVSVAANATSPQVNSITVTTAQAESNAANNTATDSTIITQPDLTITKSHTGNFTQGSTGNNYTVTVTNSGAGNKNAGQSVSVTDAPPSGLTVTAMSGAGWTCTTLPTCARTDLLAAGNAYPVLTVTVSVTANATSPQVNSIIVTTAQTESNNGNNTATDSTTITQPDLTITKSHTGNFVQGSTGNNYTVTVTNSGAGNKNVGQSVSVTDAPPTGLTVTAMSGTGWTCTTLPTCTRNDLLTPTSSYPALTVTVSVAANATSPQVNSIIVTTAQTESNNGNNTATDSTNIELQTVVTKTADTNDGLCDADCSLREATVAANSVADVNTITFNIPPADPGCTGPACTITLGGTELFLAGNVTVDGAGPNAVTVSGNNASRVFFVGGGANFISRLTMTAGNIGGGQGGGVFNSGVLTITDSTVSGSSAGTGGGIFTTVGGNTTLIGSTVSTNFGSFASGTANNPGSVMTMTNSTVSGNTGSNGGSVFCNVGATVNITSSTISANSVGIGVGGINNNGGTVSVRNSIIARNPGSGADVSGGAFTSLGYNIVGNVGGVPAFNQTGDQTGIDPLLGPLANNGGPTRTHSPMALSLAIDRGNSFGLTTDQRGSIRPIDDPAIMNVGDAADIGAVEKQATTTTIVSDNPDPSVFGQNYTVVFTVTVNSPGAGTPTGTVTVTDGTNNCSATVAVGQCVLPSTSPGAKTLTATYPGDTNFNGSSDTEAHQVDKANTTTTVTAAPASGAALFGQSVTFTATVAPIAPGAGVPAGTVTFNIDGNLYCINTPLNGSSQATCTQAGLPALAAGLRNVVALYSGDVNFNGSAGTLNYTVNKANTTTTITGDTPDPTVMGQPYAVTWTTTVTGPGAGTPTGSVTVSDGTATCVAPVAAGTCNLTSTTMGVKSLTATYSGDANFNGSVGSAPTSHTVNLQISGTVRDGLTNAPVSALSMTLFQLPAGTVITTATTNANGVYAFAGQFTGNVAVRVTTVSPPYPEPFIRSYTLTGVNITGADFLLFANILDLRTLEHPTQWVTPGAAGSMPVILRGQNNEASVAYSFTYNINPFAQPPAFVCGANAPGCAITQDNSTFGSVGVTIVPAGGAFSRPDGTPLEGPEISGPKEIARINFQTLATTTLPSTDFTFGGAPTAAAIRDAAANPLAFGVFTPIRVVFAHGIEGDVAGRFAGSGAVDAGDVVQVRNFVTGLNTPVATHNEFQRADVAPSNTKGDGTLNATDVIQVRRYGSGLDPATSAGGSGAANPAPPAPAPEAAVAGGREVKIGSANATNNSRVSIPVDLTASGDEIAASFTVRYDETRLTAPRVDLAKDAPEGMTLTVNTTEPGLIRVLVDSTTAIGRNSKDASSLINITFDVTSRAPSGDTQVELDELVISDAEARSLRTRATSGTISIFGPNPIDDTKVERVRRPTTPKVDMIEEWLNQTTVILRPRLDNEQPRTITRRQ